MLYKKVVYIVIANHNKKYKEIILLMFYKKAVYIVVCNNNLNNNNITSM